MGFSMQNLQLRHLHLQRTASRLIAAATRAAQSELVIPRQPEVSDGSWDKADVRLVQQAISDSLPGSRERTGEPGTVLLGRSLTDLQDFAQANGQPKFRGKQLYDGLVHGAHDVLDFNNVPKAWRQSLAEQGVVSGRSSIYKEVKAKDGTTKFLLQLADNHVVETVGIPLDDADKQRLTVCVSSQVGCPMRCTFCATGKGGFARNLKAHEIVDQVMTVQERFGTRVSNVVFMGMGEPLLNLRAVTAAARFINQDLGIGARHITVSTVGVPNAIGMLASHLKEHSLQLTLAVSIHAPSQAVRQRIIPSAKAYPLDALLQDCQKFLEVTGRRVTFEYTLLAGVNDAPAQAEELAEKLSRWHLRGSHVNLIPWNAVDDADFTRPSRNAVFAFRRALEAKGYPVSTRITRGQDAAAACGQLRNDNQKLPLS
ncbi:g231 [Coccomyxa viridis]|uniref:G231 protein n=1 Tax=Coccomyxa viridis TaxID=1274662 RepID=A0ABP1FKI8_9CHLO